MTTLFDTAHGTQDNQNFLYDVRHPEEILYIIFILKDQLARITLTESKMSVTYEGKPCGIVDDKVMLNGDKATTGKNDIGGLSFLVLPKQVLQTHFLVLDTQEVIIHNQNEHCAIRTLDDTLLLIDNTNAQQPNVLINPLGEFVYYNDYKITQSMSCEVKVGDTILTPDLMLERRPEQWKVTTFSKDISFNPEFFLPQHRKLENPQDFPEYRRSPRLNLQLPDATFKYEKIEDKEQAPKGGLLKAILPPVGMLVAGSAVTLMSGRNPMMMMATALASLMTVTFTITQYRTDKQDRLARETHREVDYQQYLVKLTGQLGLAHRKERQILHYQHVSPELLLEMIDKYDARLYERMVNHKDFLQVSLGIGEQASTLKVTSDYTSRDEDDWATHVKQLVGTYSQQLDVPVVLSLSNQTLGLIGNDEVLRQTVENLYLQLAFFHSYRDVNLITLVPEATYTTGWDKWRFLPHFKLKSINTRGLVYNAKSRDMVLSSFYQIVNSRKQILAAAGRETPTFLPYFVFTIFDDSYLAGHGLNEFLAEDMHDLGVTVIWCKENQKLLPETITALVEVKNHQTGIVIQDNDQHLDKLYQPYPALDSKESFEVTLRKLSGLVHMEVEKNAIPDRLSLLEQYMVETVEALTIDERWAAADPSQSIASMIGWKGKKEPAFWDLHEQVHGPHAIVGGTSGSGKSEFLTTFLMGLAINFSPEDIGMLIIDWKGGGIADTLADLPHFMGSITNLDGAGTARALASINAELKKRQREFRTYGVTNIAGYTKLYRERKSSPREGINYPSKPLPHLMLVSDEFAELKENVPEFLDELTSVARIGRSLGVHLILATQKPDGVVNDQIDANATSKVALKMSDEANSKALIKTGDAAHITQAGRGYLRVGESEVYELFQSGYGGVDYTPHATKEAIQDERIYHIHTSGQWELIYDPREDIVDQDIVKADVPTQLKATIKEIVKIFKHSNYSQPDKPWLPNLVDNIPTPVVKATGQRTLKVPLGLLDIPSDQVQENYDFDLAKSGNTVIFASSGYGKSTVLQTLTLNLAKVNTPEQLHVNLLDFGNNGLLPLKNLPHVADIVTLEEHEKLGKMLASMSETLAERKRAFKTAGVASLEQYEAKTKTSLPIILNLLDNYDGLSSNDNRKDQIDNILLQVLREGPSLGVYLILTASRVGAVRMNMMSAISTKMVLYLNDESEVTTIMGRDCVQQETKVGRGQIMRDVPTTIQFYLPVAAETSTALLANLEYDVTTLDKKWTGVRPPQIPMVPDEFTGETFETLPDVIQWQKEEKMPFGMSYETTEVLGFVSGQQPYFIFAPMDDEQNILYQQLLLRQISKVQREVLLVDFNDSFEDAIDQSGLSENMTLITDKKETRAIIKGMIGYGKLVKKHEVGESIILVISNIQDFIQKTAISANDFLVLLKNTYKAGLDIIIFGPHEYISKSFDDVPKVLRQLKFSGLVGSRIYDSALIKGTGSTSEAELSIYDSYFVIRGGSSYSKVKLPELVKGVSDV